MSSEQPIDVVVDERTDATEDELTAADETEKHWMHIVK